VESLVCVCVLPPPLPSHPALRAASRWAMDATMSGCAADASACSVGSASTLNRHAGLAAVPQVQGAGVAHHDVVALGSKAEVHAFSITVCVCVCVCVCVGGGGWCGRRRVCVCVCVWGGGGGL
jgi:hypothetical protein